MTVTAGTSALYHGRVGILEGVLIFLNDRRRAIARAYSSAFAGTGLTLPRELDGRRHVFHLYVVRSAERDALRARLRERGVETLVHYERPIYRHDGFRDLAAVTAALPATERAVAEVLSLPLYPELTDAEVQTVIEAVRDVH